MQGGMVFSGVTPTKTAPAGLPVGTIFGTVSETEVG